MEKEKSPINQYFLPICQFCDCFLRDLLDNPGICESESMLQEMICKFYIHRKTLHKDSQNLKIEELKDEYFEKFETFLEIIL